MLTAEEKKVLKSGTTEEIIQVFSAGEKPLTERDSAKVLSRLMGRMVLDYRLIQILHKRGCNMNVSDEPYRMGDYLSSYGRLSPRLIHEMSKMGYDFKQTNATGEHAGFYLAYSSILNDKVVSALKAQGVDFNLKNQNGKTVVEELGKLMLPSAILAARLSGVFTTSEELNQLAGMSADNRAVCQYVQQKINSLPVCGYENIGIQEIEQDNVKKLASYLDIERACQREEVAKRRAHEAQKRAEWERKMEALKQKKEEARKQAREKQKIVKDETVTAQLLHQTRENQKNHNR